MLKKQLALPLLEEKLSYKLRGIFFELSKEYGCLYREKVYQNLLKQSLKKNNLNFIEQPKIVLFNFKNGDYIGNYYPDFVIEDKIILEIKAQNHITDTHVNQLIRYLHSCKYEIGFIVNFGSPRVQIIRRVYSNNRKYFLN